MSAISFLRIGCLTLGGLSLSGLLCGCSKPARTAAPPSPSTVTAVPGVPSHRSMDASGLTMPQRLELLNANINPDEVLYQNRRKAAQLRARLESETDPTLNAFLLPKYAEQL